MKDRFTRRRLLIASTLLALAGCSGDDSGGDSEVPDASFDILEYDMLDIEGSGGSQVPEVTVEHSGEPITEDNSHTIRLTTEGIGNFDNWSPPPTIDGNREALQDSSGQLLSGDDVEFIWISPDTERQATLDTSTVP